MKKIIVTISLIVSALTTRAIADNQDEVFINTINSNWISANYISMISNINMRSQANSNDVLAILLKMNYYYYCDFSSSNCNTFAQTFTNIVQSSPRAELKQTAESIAGPYLNITTSEPPFTATQRTNLHLLFPQSFPGLDESLAFYTHFSKRFNIVVLSENTTGVFINVTPYDKNGFESGTTSFTRVYFDNASILLSAPGAINGHTFSHWKVFNDTAGTNLSLNITVTNNMTITAVFTN